MCELLGMNCKTPTDVCFSFTGFSHRGGDTGEHEDGWGIAFYERDGLRIFLDHQPAANSKIAEILKSYPIKSINVLAHIRKANIGKVCLQNTQPFTRELWGKNWVFIHNGDLFGFEPAHYESFCPTGETDSEKAFCVILNQIKKNFFPKQIKPHKLAELLQESADELSGYGTFNFILTDGNYMFAHRYNNLYSLKREYPFTQANLLDTDLSVNFNQTNNEDDRVTVIATRPLTSNENWELLPEKKIVVYKDGDVLNL